MPSNESFQPWEASLFFSSPREVCQLLSQDSCWNTSGTIKGKATEEAFGLKDVTAARDQRVSPFPDYELGTGLLAPSTHSFLSICSIYIDSCLNGKSDTENHCAPGQSVSVLFSASSESDPGGAES